MVISSVLCCAGVTLIVFPVHAIMRSTGTLLQSAGVAEHTGADESASASVMVSQARPPQFPLVLVPPPTLRGAQPPAQGVATSAQEQLAAQVQDSTQPTTQQLGPNLTYNLFERFIVLPEYNLLFCYIEKNACTAFNDIFSQLRMKSHPTVQRTHGPDGWFQLSPYTLGYSKEDIEAIMRNKTWHKAVFYRDPIERFVSAYRSKCEHFDSFDGNYSCFQAFGHDYESFPDATAKLFDWRNFTQKDEFVNAHFKRQSGFCGGLDRSLQYYDIVEELKESTAREKTINLLHKIGADPAELEDFDVLFPPPKVQLEEEDNHTTNTAQHLREYFPDEHPENLAEVFIYYEEDYRLFNLSKPQWETEQLAKAIEKAQRRDEKRYLVEENAEEKIFHTMKAREQELKESAVLNSQ